ncbi:unnamed protein product [Adineta ricciae]|uniref:HAT C-terminal dimerisation domain-containing protein n=1 Tax=Adineta ricciae TaxID=249248 RepID=A0A814X0U0_ADIRI|nr:unnamed protein product [Adineta ricciae]
MLMTLATFDHSANVSNYTEITLFCRIKTIPAILLQLAEFGSEQCPEWFRFYQILGTFAIGSNEAERTFSTLRNRLSDTTIEILVKLSSLKIELTEYIINCIVQDFVKNPGRTKSHNITLFLKDDQYQSDGDDDVGYF